ncbi:MAG: hypothetical protein ACOYEV_14680 [Candidatus Nanopelagicales bacterium]
MGNWFGALPPMMRALISAVLMLPVVVYPFFMAGTLTNLLVSVAYFVAVLVVLARSRRRRSFALSLAAVTGAIVIAMGVFLAKAVALGNVAAVVILLFPLGFVAAWSFARRNHSGFWMGLLLASPFAVGMQYVLVHSPSDQPGQPVRPIILMSVWGISTATGCLVAWCVDLAARKIGQNKSQAGGAS